MRLAATALLSTLALTGAPPSRAQDAGDWIALPFEHDINLNGGDKVARTKHLPRTVSLQYHYSP